jgi:hypothetical protein
LSRSTVRNLLKKTHMKYLIRLISLAEGFILPLARLHAAEAPDDVKMNYEQC